MPNDRPQVTHSEVKVKRDSVASSCDLLQASSMPQERQCISNITPGKLTKAISAYEQVVATYLEPRWWRRTRMHVALLGLAIAAVNCYAQATFCIAIVEMVLPADYTPSDLSSSTKLLVANNLTATSQKNASFNLFREFSSESIIKEDNDKLDGDESCPIEYMYRHYYDTWRFPPNTGSSNGSSSNGLLAASASSKTIDVSNRFDWDASQQGLLLGAFAFGMAPLQVVGGRLAEIYGAKWVLLVGCIGTALTNITIPSLAHLSFTLLLINRVLMGISQAGMEPGLMCLLADWMTPNEASFYISMLLFAICAGFFLGSLLSSFILALGYGWPLAYYVSGSLNLAMGLVWLWYADSWPKASRFISPSELDHIQSEQARSRQEQSGLADDDAAAGLGDSKTINQDDGLISSSCSFSSLTTNLSVSNPPVAGDQKYQHMFISLDTDGTKQSENNNNNNNTVIHHQLNIGSNTINEPIESSTTGRAPWAKILSTRSVWAFIICKISIRWCADVVSNELPTYLANVLHLSIEINGLLNSISSALFAIFSFLTGWLVTELSKQPTNNERKEMDKTNLRKIFQSTASFGTAAAVFLMSYYDCNLIFSMSMLLLLSCCLVMGTGGELQIPYDMTSRYPGTLHGMACSLSVSGWLAPPLIGLILGDKPSSRQRWRTVWYLTATINLIGGLVFVLFADASRRDFDTKPKSKSFRKKSSSSSSASSDEVLKKASNAKTTMTMMANRQPSKGLMVAAAGLKAEHHHHHQMGKPTVGLESSSSASCELAPAGEEARKQQQHQQQQPVVVLMSNGQSTLTTNEGYSNAACSPASTCNNSPKLPGSVGLRRHSALYFDEKLIRQLSSTKQHELANSCPTSRANFSPLLANLELVLPLESTNKLADCESRHNNSLPAVERQEKNWYPKEEEENYNSSLSQQLAVTSSQTANKEQSDEGLVSLWRPTSQRPNTTTTTSVGNNKTKTGQPDGGAELEREHQSYQAKPAGCLSEATSQNGPEVGAWSAGVGPDEGDEEATGTVTHL